MLAYQRPALSRVGVRDGNILVLRQAQLIWTLSFIVVKHASLYVGRKSAPQPQRVRAPKPAKD